MTIKLDVIAEIKRRVPKGDLLYDIAKDNRIGEWQVRKWAMCDGVHYMRLRNRWISSVREGRNVCEQHNEPETVHQGYKRRRAFIRFGTRIDR